MMQSHQRLSQYKIQNYENKIILSLQIYYFQIQREMNSVVEKELLCMF
jgi:hypothetical protein